MAGSFDFLHIKRRTAGSSNELSFDVLEHKSAEADGKTRSAKAPKAPKASKGTFHGVGNSSTLSGQAEVEKRKRARQNRRVQLYAFVAVVVVALVTVGVYAGMRFQEDQANVAARVGDLVERLSSVDETLLEIDEMMADPFNADQAERRAAQLSGMPKLTTELNRVSVDAQSLLTLPLDEQTEVAVGQLNTAAQTRNAMLTAAADAFRLSAESSAQVERANTVWNGVLNADQLARDAIAASNKATTQEATSQSLDDIRTAIDGFEYARGELADISVTYGVDLSAQDAYLAKKVEALEQAAVTSEALLAGDRDAAKAASDAYNTADEQAVALAAALPASIGDIVQNGFTRNIASIENRYQEARDRAVAADSVIREYLGG